MKGSEVRNRFIEYFKKHNHAHVASSRLVPDNDPTLLFTNSGMVQFKNVFLGLEKRNYSRATTSQKCLRAGGKHNDLENVGYTSRHHTFFEMLGNFSFGDYFKKDAIRFAWEFLTSDLKIPKEKLYVTVFRDDDEAFEIWNKQEKVDAKKISRFDEKDNFWQMGDTGPCGPCSEIFYDHGPENGCGKKDCKVGCSCDRFVEIWNLVFMQFNRDEKGKLTPLPKPSIDTGSGLERLSAVMQKVPSNYQTDLFTDLFTIMERHSQHKYVTLSDTQKADPKNAKTEELNTAMRVVADHIRSTTFLIADGILPSNEGQGYVLRRIMRRGIRYGHKLTNKSLFVPVAQELIRTMSDAYPELRSRESFIVSTISAEEERFNQTLGKGTELLNAALTEIKGKKTVPGDVVFKLYDTYGFPVDLTSLMAKEKGFSIDAEGFEQLMNESRQVAKASWRGGSEGDSLQPQMIKAASTLSKTHFLGYDGLQCESKILDLVDSTGKVQQIVDKGAIVLDQTTFYAESGGQVGDTGLISGKGFEAQVMDTKKINDVFFHIVKVKSGSLKTGATVTCRVDQSRLSTMQNHSATHLLHAALRKVLGDHVTQAGSLVEAPRLRFDFTHPKPLSRAELHQIETLVNDEIASAREVDSRVVSYDNAIKDGAMALFGEKYGNDVRVIKMGEFSQELCGGTHVRNTADIRIFKIMSEGGVSSGVRRIEAITGQRAVHFLMERHDQLGELEEHLRVEPGKAPERVKKLTEQIKKLEKDFKSAVTQGQSTNLDDIIKLSRQIGGANVVSAVVEVSDREVLSSLTDKIKDKVRSGIIVLIGKNEEGGPSPIVVTVTRDLVQKYHAGNILKEVAAVMGGKGGGRPDFAQGAGPESAKAEKAASKVFELL
ncbi:MAG: alanine--tRNA ligase [Oligoflexia bacterium]|nr:alanine--tRNA ligase [Oligoflexia bacterium]